MLDRWPTPLRAKSDFLSVRLQQKHGELGMAGEEYVFISYARQDGETAAKQLVEELGKDSRVHPWRDRLQMRPGDFEEQIRQAIESSRYLVLVLTPAAICSDWVKKEWRLAQKRGVCVLPVKSAPETELS